MVQCFRRSLLTGLAGAFSAGALSACAGYEDPPPLTLDWLLGQWQGGLAGQQLTVTSIETANDMARGAWSGETVAIIVNGSKLRFVTASGASVQLTHIADATMVGTIDRAPWLRQSTSVARVFLQRVT